MTDKEAIAVLAEACQAIAIAGVELSKAVDLLERRVALLEGVKRKTEVMQ